MANRLKKKASLPAGFKSGLAKSPDFQSAKYYESRKTLLFTSNLCRMIISKNDERKNEFVLVIILIPF